jgi:hypothetical protein
MLRHKELMPRFIKSIPRQLEPGVLYVSMEYGTAVHSCCCGCGQEVVTPLTPTDWQLTNNSGKVSLWPSVGNWNLQCQSHYVIRDNRVLKAGSWSDARIKAERRRDKAAKAEYYAKLNQSQQPNQLPTRKEPVTESIRTSTVPQESCWQKIWKWLTS